MSIYLDELTKTVAALAATADEQLAFLKAEGERDGVLLDVDELALELERLVNNINLGQSGISGVAIKILNEIDLQLEGMSGKVNGHLWTPEGLRTAPEWAAIRVMAANALDAINVSNLNLS